MWFLFRFLWILFVYSISSFVFIWILKLHYNFDCLIDWLFNNNYNESVDRLFDYIIVGAGSAGCVLAARLAENSAHNILLIEAGGHPFLLHDIPLAAPMLQLTPYDWQFKTEPQKNACLGMTEQRSLWPRGKLVGGTSRLNYMVYLRGHKADFNSWLSDDCIHWTQDEIKEYFKRSENQIGIYANDSKHHNTHGPYHVSDLSHISGMVGGLLNAAEELGLGVGDLNGATGTGFMQTQATSHNGARYSADHILEGRTNIKVLPYTQVTKVLLRQNFEAYGVRCVRHGQHFTVRARQEVILSAGTIGSPHILLLSGVGPAKHLSEHKIKVSVDLPVGENLQDHVATGLDLVITNQSSPLSWYTAVNPINPLNYLLYGQGPLTHPGCEVVGTVYTDGHTDGPPDVQYMALPGGLSSDAGAVLKRVMGISDKLFRDYFAPLVGTPVATLLPTVLHPRSRGHVQLKSRNYQDPPLIDPKYLTHPHDIKILIQALEILVKLTNTNAMARIGGSVYTKPLPPCAHHVFSSHEYWECYIRHLTITAYHMVGTCRMGSYSNPTSVVDYTLRVHGTSRLRVVDASIMPTLPSSNTNAVVMMIAEKAADLIKANWHHRLAVCTNLDVFLTRHSHRCV